jgi:NitT/TauT family transport system permease protein
VAILFIAESMAGSTGLGYFIMHSWSLLEYSRMFAGIIVFAIMGVVIYEVFDLAERKFARGRRVA